MAFRNPLTVNPITSFPASGLTGQVESNQIVDELVGKTITGSLIRTAATGRRWEISAIVTNLINAFTGHAAETTPGALTVTASASGQGNVTLQAPGTAAGIGAGLSITGPDPATGNSFTGGSLAADYGSIGDPGLSGIDWTPQGPAGGAATTVQGMNVYIPGTVRGQPYTVSGSTVATPTGGGAIALPYGVTFMTTPWPVVSSGSGAIICSGVGISTTAGQAILYDAAGIIVTTGPRRVNWTVTGILA